MDFVPFLNAVVCSPYRRKACCFRCHNIDAVSVINRKICYTVTDKFHYFIFNISIIKNSTDNGKCNVLRAYSLFRLSCEIYADYLRSVYIICFIKKLFNKLRAAFAHSHCSERTVTCMAVRAENHFACSAHHFTHILVDNCLMCRYIYTAIFLCTGKAEKMVVLIYCSADSTKAVMTVGKDIRHREFFKSACSCCLNNTYICNIM